MVSALPYFTWLMILVAVASLLAQTVELYNGNGEGKSMLTYYWWMDLLFVVFTVAELILKVGVAVGCGLVYLRHLYPCKVPCNDFFILSADSCQWIFLQPPRCHPECLGCH